MECSCSKERFAKGLKSLGREEVQIIIEEDGKAETVCQNCGAKYFFTFEELKRILDEIL